MSGLKSVWYNASEMDAVLGEHREAVQGNGWAVVNGRKKLPGVITWKGEPRAGVYYAAGPRERFEGIWRTQGGVVLMPISNEKILETLCEWVKARGLVVKGEQPSATIERMGGVATLASQLGFPWQDTTTLDLEVIALRDRVEQLVAAATVDAAELKLREQKPLEVTFDIHAVSEQAIRTVVAHFTAHGWTVKLDPPETRMRRWSMSRS